MHPNWKLIIGAVLILSGFGVWWSWSQGGALLSALSKQPPPVLPAVGVSPAAAQAGELTTARCDQQETSFGDLTADALCADSGTVISLVAAVSFKTGSIPGTGASRAEVESLLQTPEETWAVSRLTGAQIRRALERSLSRAPLPNPNAFLQVSGLTVVYDPNRPRDKRIISLNSPQGPVEPERQYEVVMPLALAQGGSGYFQIFGKDDIIRQGSTGLADAILQYLQANPNKSYTGQGRIVVGG